MAKRPVARAPIEVGESFEDGAFEGMSKDRGRNRNGSEIRF